MPTTKSGLSNNQLCKDSDQCIYSPREKHSVLDDGVQITICNSLMRASREAFLSMVPNSSLSMFNSYPIFAKFNMSIEILV